jgi:hypothetical protein
MLYPALHLAQDKGWGRNIDWHRARAADLVTSDNSPALRWSEAKYSKDVWRHGRIFYVNFLNVRQNVIN